MGGIETEKDEVIVNALGRPESIFAAQLAYDQTLFFFNGRPSPFSRLSSPEESESLPMPLHDGGRLHQVSGFPPVRPEAIEKCPEEAEGWREPRSRLFPLVDAMFQHGQLAFSSKKSCRQA